MLLPTGKDNRCFVDIYFKREDNCEKRIMSCITKLPAMVASLPVDVV